MYTNQYTKDKIKEGHEIPQIINPYRLGQVDLDAIPKQTPIFMNLLSRGELVQIDSDDFRMADNLAAALTSALLTGLDVLKEHWKLGCKQTRKCVVFTDPGNRNRFYSEMVDRGVEEFDLFDSSHFYSQPSEFETVLLEYQPAVCVLNLHTKSLNKTEIKVVEQMLTTCRRRNISVLFFDSKSELKFSGFDTEVKVLSKGDEYVVETTANTGEPIEAFRLICDEKSFSSHTMSTDELAKVHNRKQKTYLPEVDPNLNFEGI